MKFLFNKKKTDNKQPNDGEIKRKVILGFASVGGAVAIAVLVTYVSFSLLQDSVERLAERDTRLLMLNKIRADVADADNMIREYTLNQDDSVYKTYQSTVDMIYVEIDSLKKHPANNFKQRVRIDSIATLLRTESKGLVNFMKERNYAKLKDPLTAVVNKLEKEKEKQLIKSLAKKSRAEEIPDLDPISLPLIYRKYRIIALRLYEKEDKPKMEVESVERILSNALKKEGNINAYMTRREINLLRQSAGLMTKIQQIIDSLQDEARFTGYQKANEARSVIKTSTYALLAVTVLALICVGIFVYLIFSDISKSDFYQKMLIKEKRRAEFLKNAKEEFLANMSHEIRTPLNALMGFTEQFAYTPLNGMQQEYLTAVRNSSEHLLATVNDILDMSKIEAGKLNMESVPFRADLVVKEVCDALSLKAKEKNLDLKYFMGEGTSQILSGDPTRLRQVLFNLIQNAVKFTEEGFVEVECEIEKETKKEVALKIYVNDTGIGIPADKQSAIFEDFSQADSSISRKYGGTGLGLAICKKLLKMQDGEISFDSTPGEGTSFTVSISYPKSSEKEVKTHERPQEVNGSLLSGKRLLVVDDDPLNMRLTQIILNKWGVITGTSLNGHDALRKMTDSEFDLVLTDMQMPEMSGLDLTKAIRKLQDKQKANIPVVAFTANMMRGDLEEYKKAGINDFLLKPFKEVEMFEKLANVLEVGTIEEVNSHISNTKKRLEKPKAKNGKKNGEAKAYSLDNFKKFTGDDPEALAEVLSIFLSDNQQNLSSFKKAALQSDWKEVSSLSHKMLHAYENLQVKPMIPLLKDLELMGLAPKGQDERRLKSTVDKAVKIAEDIHGKIENELA
ncbi:ATP-binding protein [Flammeovirgaceae bacterium SG7u.111]|nr:ATP-binding protein [Flammeovirgaceae bacterium SG7u.132]WPO34297.1 ATP-binding protein [Flammeovirgaceae bacterium SG7u.111]